MKQLFQGAAALRKRLYEYREWLYLPFVLGTGWAKSFACSSQDRVVMAMLAVTVLLLAVKLVVTDYTLREFILIGVMGILLVLNYLNNGAFMLTMTFLAIIGAKGINLERVFVYSLWPKAVLTILRVLFAATGIMENNGGYVGKAYGTVYLNFYGFDHSNVLSINITGIMLLAFLVYHDKMKWYAYIIGEVLLAATFPFLQCKTSLIVWAVFCLLNAARWLCGKWRIEQIYLKLCAAIPLILCAFSYAGAAWYHSHPESGRILTILFTGRIQLMERALYGGEKLKLLSGLIPSTFYDIGYFHIPYNYGWLIFALWLAAYVVAIWKCAKCGKKGEVLVLAAISLYIFMETSAARTFWNVPLLYLAWALYPEDVVCSKDETQRG